MLKGAAAVTFVKWPAQYTTSVWLTSTVLLSAYEKTTWKPMPASPQYAANVKTCPVWCKAIETQQNIECNLFGMTHYPMHAPLRRFFNGEMRSIIVICVKANPSV
jgi:hypothetical protein